MFTALMATNGEERKRKINRLVELLNTVKNIPLTGNTVHMPATADPPASSLSRQKRNHRAIEDDYPVASPSYADMTPPISDGEPPAKRRRPVRTALTAASIDQFRPINFAMTKEIQAGDLQSLRMRFYDQLLTRKITSKNKTTKLLFKPKKAAQLTSYFFEQTQGPVALKHVANFIKGYTPKRGALDMGSSARAIEVSRNADTPASFQHFFYAWSQQHDKAASKNQAIRHISSVMNARRTLRSYEKACDDICNGEPEVAAYCAKHNFTTSSGRNKKSVAIDILSKLEGGGDRAAFKREIDRARSVDILAHKLGNAFLLLTPPKSISLLEKIGPECLDIGCDILLEVCPYVRGVVHFLEEWVWKPSEQAVAKLPMQTDELLSDDQAHTFFDLLRKAVRDGTPGEEQQYITDTTAIGSDSESTGSEEDDDEDDEEEDDEEGGEEDVNDREVQGDHDEEHR